MTASEQREKDIIEATNMYLYKTSKLHDAYSYAYRFTNENVDSIWSLFEFSANVKLLSVLSSGDQLFDMVLNGIKNADTFDCNRIAEYYTLGFKKVAIETLNYYQFLDLFNYEKRSRKKSKMENYVISCAPEEYKNFWQELFYNLKQSGINSSVFDFVRGENIQDVLLNNRCNYLKTNENYTSLQKALRESNITFKYNDIKNIPEGYGKYDFIYISNIMDYFNDIFSEQSELDALSSTLELLQKIYDVNLNKPGEILLTYFPRTFINEILNRNSSAKFSPVKISCTKKVRYPNAVALEKGRVLWKK
ncbi:MAG: DUF3419 family protein [Bacilli bacterium]|nr:DUF3419 family protein [Bacilli bacterium]